MIYLRDDDVLVSSSSKNEFARFKQIHEWTVGIPNLIHVPTILVTEIQGYPECIEYIKEETAQRRMQPEFHGMSHIDYKKLSKREIRNHLMQGRDFIRQQFNWEPTLWATPWGAESIYLKEAAEEQDFILQNCTTDVISIENATAGLKNGTLKLEDLDEKYIFFHFWKRGLRVKRISETVRHGSWAAAAKANPDLF